MKQIFLTLLLLATLASCRKFYDAPIPPTTWDLFSSPAATPLKAVTRQRVEGVYNFGDGAGDFGTNAALRWSYNAHGTDTTWYLSFFNEKDVSYFICEGRRLDSALLLNGYWRKMAGTATGKVQLTIKDANGGRNLLRDSGYLPGPVQITGLYSYGDTPPDQPVTLTYARPLFNRKPLERVVHRGGGQTADLLPASENSAEIIELASRFGATGVEIDVRMTKDGVPILFHDADLSERLIKKNGMVGPIHDYTYAQLDALVRLIRNGEHIPTLRQALETVVYRTPLRFVWLDTKFDGPLDLLRSIQAEYLQKAAAIGRSVDIRIGIPTTQVLDQLKALPGYQNIPSVSELDTPYLEEANSGVWGPRWTLGLQNERVDQVHAEGRRVFVWTLDLPANMASFMAQGHFDGILTDYPSALAYLYYVQQ
jgi:glycerophosphoryl diester phosphodiesterase